MKHLLKNAIGSFCLTILSSCFLVSLMSFQSSSNNVAFEETPCPTASFSTQNNGCVGPCAITFINQSLNATSYHWDFDDGNESTDTNPVHTYQDAGSYSVTLTAIIDGCQHEFIGTVDVIGA